MILNDDEGLAFLDTLDCMCPTWLVLWILLCMYRVLVKPIIVQ